MQSSGSACEFLEEMRLSHGCCRMPAGQGFIVNKMQPDDRRKIGLVKVECGDRFLHIVSQLVPIIALSDDRLSKTFGHEAAVGFLSDFENDLSHCFRLSQHITENKVHPLREIHPRKACDLM